MSNVLLLENNLNDLDNFYNYDKIIMKDCIFITSKNDYYKTCEICGLHYDSSYHSIFLTEFAPTLLFDMNTKFLKQWILKFKLINKHLSNKKLNIIIDDKVYYPYTYEINVKIYTLHYNEYDYFKTVKNIINCNY